MGSRISRPRSKNNSIGSNSSSGLPPPLDDLDQLEGSDYELEELGPSGLGSMPTALDPLDSNARKYLSSTQRAHSAPANIMNPSGHSAFRTRNSFAQSPTGLSKISSWPKMVGMTGAPKGPCTLPTAGAQRSIGSRRSEVLSPRSCPAVRPLRADRQFLRTVMEMKDERNGVPMQHRSIGVWHFPQCFDGAQRACRVPSQSGCLAGWLAACLPPLPPPLPMPTHGR